MAKETKNDLRWQRTERHLLDALAVQLRDTPLERIKVVDIARDAEISKATFYLHYQDVFDLADALIDSRIKDVLDELGDPFLPVTNTPEFLRRFVTIFTSEDHREFTASITKNHLGPRFMLKLGTALGERVNEILPAPDVDEGKIAIAFTIGGLINAIQVNSDMEPELLIEKLTNVFENFMSADPPIVTFPHFSGAN